MASTSREARASVSKFDRNAILWSGKWVEIDRVAETVELFLSAPFLERWNEKSQIDRCYSLLIELEASSSRHIERSVRNLSKSCISRKRFSLYRERFICRWERPVSFWRNEDECCLRKWISLIFTFVKHSSVLNAVNVIIIEIFAKERIFV